jgi:hypothetical protein
MITRDITEDTLAKKSASAYELSILIGVDSFDYIVLDNERQVLALRTYSFDPGGFPASLEGVFQSDKFLHQAFSGVRLGLADGKNTLIPNRLYQEAEKGAYLQQVTELRPEDKVEVDVLPQLGVCNVYVVEKEVEAFARRAFPACRLAHQITALLPALRSLAVQQEGPAVFAHLKAGQFHLFVFEGGDLLLANTFPYKNAKDFIYYVLMAFQQTGLNPEQQKLYFSGRLLKDSEIYKEAYRYIRQIEFLGAPAGLQLGPRLSQEPAYLHFGLLSLSLL